METMIRTYNELIELKTFDERYNYLKLNGVVSELTFGFDRYINQLFYKDPLWLSIRDKVVVRDLGCDLGLEGYEIYGSIYVHHMNPIRVDDIINRSDYLLNPDYLICSSFNTHNAIHYGKQSPNIVVDRKPGDTCPWKR